MRHFKSSNKNSPPARAGQQVLRQRAGVLPRAARQRKTLAGYGTARGSSMAVLGECKLLV